MYEPEICPKCSARFDARDALVSSGVPYVLGVIYAPGVSAAVRCPGCKHAFSASTLRFFGFLSPNALRWALVAAFVIGVTVVVGSSLG